MKLSELYEDIGKRLDANPERGDDEVVIRLKEEAPGAISTTPVKCVDFARGLFAMKYLITPEKECECL